MYVRVNNFDLEKMLRFAPLQSIDNNNNDDNNNSVGTFVVIYETSYYSMRHRLV